MGARPHGGADTVAVRLWCSDEQSTGEHLENRLVPSMACTWAGGSSNALTARRSDVEPSPAAAGVPDPFAASGMASSAGLATRSDPPSDPTVAHRPPRPGRR